jgi:hypothetical protein
MKRLAVAAAVTALAAGGFVLAPARADVTVCHDVSLTVIDQSFSDSGCNAIPTTPPELPAP